MTIEILMVSGEYRHLKDIPNSPPPTNLMAWFEASKQVMNLPNAVCHYIENKTIKEMSKHITSIGALGTAYVEDNLFAFVESDNPKLYGDRRTITHEMLHLKGWFHGDVCHEDYENEVERLYQLTEESLPIIVLLGVRSNGK